MVLLMIVYNVDDLLWKVRAFKSHLFNLAHFCIKFVGLKRMLNVGGM